MAMSVSTGVLVEFAGETVEERGVGEDVGGGWKGRRVGFLIWEQFGLIIYR